MSELRTKCCGAEFEAQMLDSNYNVKFLSSPEILELNIQGTCPICHKPIGIEEKRVP